MESARRRWRAWQTQCFRGAEWPRERFCNKRRFRRLQQAAITATSCDYGDCNKLRLPQQAAITAACSASSRRQQIAHSAHRNLPAGPRPPPAVRPPPSPPPPSPSLPPAPSPSPPPPLRRPQPLTLAAATFASGTFTLAGPPPRPSPPPPSPPAPSPSPDRHLDPRRRHLRPVAAANYDQIRREKNGGSEHGGRDKCEVQSRERMHERR